jgi:riboflavin biosynthesis pyrimidine reductase
VWTAEYIYPPLADVYQELRMRLGKSEPPLNVVVTGSGDIDLERRLFGSGEVPSLIVTTAAGVRRLGDRLLPNSARVVASEAGPLSARAVLDAIGRTRQCDMVLIEAGPRLMSDFFAERLIDELFLTLAPQVAGRDGEIARPGFVNGKLFAPEHPVWGTLVGLKSGGDHLFLRYAFAQSE